MNRTAPSPGPFDPPEAVAPAAARAGGGDPAAVLARLAVKRGVSLGVLAGSRPDEFRIVLAAAAAALPEGRTSTEREVNDALAGWLAGPGSMLAVDHVELRRWLVDTGLVTRDGYGRAYERAAPPPAYALVVEALRAADPARIVEAARAASAIERERRRAEHERRGRAAT